MSISGSSGKESQKKNYILLGIGVGGAISFIIGIILLSNYTEYHGYEIVKDYTDCTIFGNNEKKCKDSVTDYNSKECSCYIQVEVTETMKPPVTVYYELESYDQIFSKYAKSRDDNQLSGHLSPNPAGTCGPEYSYVNTSTGRMPIAPCGELADAMFTDMYSMHINNEYILTVYSGLITEEKKKNFKNPPGKNLQEVFKDYAKPINWKKNIWELDTKNQTNNGFQNEAFIIWMDTDLKRKPSWHVNHTKGYENGIPPANYTLRVLYTYPTSRYAGQRKVIISNKRSEVNALKLGFGIVLLIIGVVCLALACVMLYKLRSTINCYRQP